MYPFSVNKNQNADTTVSGEGKNRLLESGVKIWPSSQIPKNANPPNMPKSKVAWRDILPRSSKNELFRPPAIPVALISPFPSPAFSSILGT